MFKETHNTITPTPSQSTNSKPTKAERRAARRGGDTAKPAYGLPAEAKPAARFMNVGGQPKPVGQQPAYKLRQKLADLDLQLQHPHLDRKWRKKIASPRAEQIPVERGHGKPKVRKQR